MMTMRKMTTKNVIMTMRWKRKKFSLSRQHTVYTDVTTPCALEQPLTVNPPMTKVCPRRHRCHTFINDDEQAFVRGDGVPKTWPHPYVTEVRVDVAAQLCRQLTNDGGKNSLVVCHFVIEVHYNHFVSVFTKKAFNLKHKHRAKTT